MIATLRHEPGDDRHGILHLPPPPDYRCKPPAHSLVVPPDAFLPRRRRRNLLRGRIAGCGGLRQPRNRRLKHQNSRNLAGAVARHGDVAGASGILGGENRRQARTRRRQF